MYSKPRMKNTISRIRIDHVIPIQIIQQYQHQKSPTKAIVLVIITIVAYTCRELRETEFQRHVSRPSI